MVTCFFALLEVKINCSRERLQSESHEDAGAPLGVVDGQLFAVADIREIVDHCGADKHVAYLSDDGAPCRDDDLGEVVVERNAIVVHPERRVAVDGERGKGREMEQPVAAWHPVVALSRADADVRHLEQRLVGGFGLGLLSLTRESQQETAC